MRDFRGRRRESTPGSVFGEREAPVRKCERPVPEGNPDDTHPYIQKQLASMLNISTQDLYALIWYYKMKEVKKYHLEITVSKNGKTHKFSEFALQFLQEKLKEFSSNPEEFDKIRTAYKNRNKVEEVTNG